MKLLHYVACSLSCQRTLDFTLLFLYSSQLPYALQQLHVFKMKLGNCFIAGLVLHIEVICPQTEWLYSQ